MILEQHPIISEGDTDTVAIDYTDYLDSDELLTGTPTVVADDEDVVIANKQINSVAITILGRTVAIGKAVLFSIQGQSAGEIQLTITASTNATPARTKVVKAGMTCVE